MHLLNNLCAAILIAATLAGCSKKPEESAYVARVGDALLTSNELNALGNTQPEHLSRQFISNWVTSEILYQEARRNGFTEAEGVLRQIEDAKRQLAINAFLEKEIYSDDSSGLNEAALEQEFKSNIESFRLREDVVKISYVMFDERDAANTLRSKVLRGAKWNDAVQEMQSDPGLSKQLLRVATNEYFTEAMLYPGELWKVARTLSKEEVSYVVKTSAGHCVLLLHDAKHLGELPEYDYAKDEIKQRIIIERRTAKYNELLATLRSKYEVDVRLASADSTRQNTNE